ncbi:MAG TPA: hypothetical protein EYN79_04960, partial [Planctomycetes bacterium]|nr:hypothetical protein [Planctomycetota bacterium]
EVYEDWFYQGMFLFHLLLGIVLILPFVIFAAVHIKNTHSRPNRRAVKAGYALLSVSLVLLFSGVLLTRIEGLLELRDPATRAIIYWLHVITPLVAAWVFILHRLAGPKIKWKVGGTWAGIAAVFAIVMMVLQSQDPRNWNVTGPAEGEKYFFPSLARTVTGDFIPAMALQRDAYCQECHPTAHQGWAHSAHRLSSFNNPAYLFSVRETRKVALERDGDVQASRFCAGCHDPVPFFSGAFDDPNFDDVGDPTASAGITCSVCHAITHVNSPRGNADFTIEEPSQYPFAFSDNPLLAWINRQLIKAKPAFHRQTFLKPLHTEAEFCGACHKVHLPEELNKYRWLRGQNHYDSWLLSGVSGHGVASFYYPQTAIPNCTKGCHMPLVEADDFGARSRNPGEAPTVHDHLFATANTAIPYLLEMPDEVIEAHQKALEKVLRVDIFGIKEKGTIDGALTAPIGPEVPTLQPGSEYLLEVVLRTIRIGHLFTQGTADSNEIWVEVLAKSGGKVVGSNGGRDSSQRVDPWSHFINAYVLDRHGERIDRRNAQDIFVALYNNQIPPGAGDVVHYRLKVPEDAEGSLQVRVRVFYRKFDTTYLQLFRGNKEPNDLPITLLAEDEVSFSIGGSATGEVSPGRNTPPEWIRWNDYGIGLLRKGGKGSVRGELRQAMEAFEHVAELGRPDGPLNRARAEIRGGDLDGAVISLERATNWDPPANPWSVDWFSAQVNIQNGNFDDALESLMALFETRYQDARDRGFDFSRDVRLTNAIGTVHFARARKLRGGQLAEQQRLELLEAVTWFDRTLITDPENAAAHYNLSQIHTRLGNDSKKEIHAAHHARYKLDDNARDRAVTLHRSRNKPADHAAEAIVIRDLHRQGAFPVPEGN